MLSRKIKQALEKKDLDLLIYLLLQQNAKMSYPKDLYKRRVTSKDFERLARHLSPELQKLLEEADVEQLLRYLKKNSSYEVRKAASIVLEDLASFRTSKVWKSVNLFKKKEDKEKEEETPFKAKSSFVIPKGDIIRPEWG